MYRTTNYVRNLLIFARDKAICMRLGLFPWNHSNPIGTVLLPGKCRVRKEPRTHTSKRSNTIAHSKSPALIDHIVVAI